MTKFTANFPRIVVERGLPFEVAPHSDWLISITDKGHLPAQVVDDFGQVLFVDFDDAELPIDGTCITDSDADSIAAFIEQARHAEVNVWVNCHAGICRSGAIADVLNLLGWETAETHLSPQRIANRLVFNKVRHRFQQLTSSWD